MIIWVNLIFSIKKIVVIRKDTAIIDDAAVEFTKMFYRLLLTGKSVIESFETAKQNVSGHVLNVFLFNLFSL